MSLPISAAFWSYAHDDDTSDGGEIVELAKRLQREYSLLTGEKLDLFVDRNSLMWGDEWRQRIDQILVQTTYFVPILTPRYFQRPECRREFIDFNSRLQGQELSGLLMPILYVAIEEFTEDNPDELIAIAASRQFFDWTNLRLDGFESRTYRQALNTLANRLIAAGRDAAAEILEREIHEPIDGGDDIGILDLVESLEAIIEGWLEIIESVDIMEGQITAVLNVYSPKLNRLQGMSTSGRASLLRKFTEDILPIQQNFLKASLKFRSVTIEIDPPMRSAIRIIADDPHLAPLFSDTWRKINDVYERNVKSQEPGDSLGEMLKPLTGLSRNVLRMKQNDDKADKAVDEGNSIIENWVRLYQESLKPPGSSATP